MDRMNELIWAMLTPNITPDIEDLHGRIAAAKREGTLTDELLNECKDAECIMCGAILCPHQEPLHFHHDGCPCCSMEEP